MTMIARTPAVQLTSLAAALLSAFGASAQDADLDKLTKPGSRAELGIGYVDQNNNRFGQYNGLNEQGGYLLFDFNLNRRDEATGSWLQFIGRNVGLDMRELRFDHRRQGNWGYFIDYNQIPRYNQYIVNTGLQGIGTGSVAVSSVGRQDVNLDTQRKIWTLGFDKVLPAGWDFSVRFKNEDKDGSRQWGRGNTTGGFEWLADPINYNTKQLEAVAAFTGKSLQLSGGYYGTAFNNSNTQINSVGGTLASTTAIGNNFQTMGLPPDNESHQLYLSGGYSITPTTRATFKLARARITQDDAFAQGFRVSAAVPSTVPLAPGIGSDLGGRIDTTQAQLGLTARPLRELTVRADWRYNDRDDKTPLRQYLAPVAVGATTDGFNEPRSITTNTGKLEASYLLPMAFRLTGTYDYEQKKRNTSPVRIVSFRDETEENTGRVELRRSLSETLNGAVSYQYSDRTGSAWQTTTLLGGAVGSNLVHPLHLADRERKRWRLTLDWTPLEQLGLNFMYDDAKDTYGSNNGRIYGPRSGKAELYTLDAVYSLSDKWQLNGWFSNTDTKADPDQQMCENATSGVTGNCTAAGAGTLADPIWSAGLRNVAETWGIGLRGKPMARLEIGVEFIYAKDLGQFKQAAVSPANAPIAQIPDSHFERQTFKLNAKYALDKNSGVRLLYAYDRFKTDDWQWTTWNQYTDGTTVRQDPLQKVNFIGISYYHEFR